MKIMKAKPAKQWSSGCVPKSYGEEILDLRNSTGNTEENPTSGGIKRGFLEYFGCVFQGVRWKFLRHLFE